MQSPLSNSRLSLTPPNLQKHAILKQIKKCFFLYIWPSEVQGACLLKIILVSHIIVKLVLLQTCDRCFLDKNKRINPLFAEKHEFKKIKSEYFDVKPVSTIFFLLLIFFMILSVAYPICKEYRYWSKQIKCRILQRHLVDNHDFFFTRMTNYV